MMIHQIFTACIAIVFVCLAISTCCMTESTKSSGFTVDLIHRDSPDSPFYDSSLAHSQRVANVLQRSFNRVNHLKHGRRHGHGHGHRNGHGHGHGHRNGHTTFPQSDVTNSHGEYLMKYSIGSPPVPTLGIADTGSDITWTQCQPCITCFKQSTPMFDPRKSSTYKNALCKSQTCSAYQGTDCSEDGKSCLYSVMYGDGSYTYGELSTDTITLGSNTGSAISFRNIALGCGKRNAGIFEGGESGIVGLGVGKSSLVQQLGRSIQGKFSYCLVPLSQAATSSKLHFGANAVVSGRGVISTPMIPESYYYLTLEAITIGKQRLEINPLPDQSKANPSGANIIIDSGTTLTYLPSELFDKLVAAIKSKVRLRQVEDAKGRLDLCYYTRKDITKPGDVTFNFKGANVHLKPENMFLRLNETLQCLAVKASESPIFGNLAQTNFLVGYDLQKNTVSFKPFNCTKT